MSVNEPTVGDVLEEVKSLRAAMVAAFAEQRRDFQRRLEGFQRGVHLEVRALDGRMAVVEATADDLRVELRDLAGDVREVRELCQELLGLAHAHPGGVS